MKHTTVCYIENDGKYLMIHRTKKKNDANHDKWLGIGGKLEDGESPHECIVREVLEETGLSILPKYRGFITFVSNEYGTEYMHLFSASGFNGTQRHECEEGDLEWIDKSYLRSIPMWEGDKIFLDLLETENAFFSVKLVYEGDRLVNYKIDI